MKLISQPRLVESRLGLTWLRSGFTLFHRQPLAWTLILLMYWAGMLLLAFIPLIGMVAPLILSPGLALGFMEIARAVDERRPPSPPLLISAFRSSRARPVLLLGVWYVIEILAILFITVLIDGGALFGWITGGAVPTAEEMGSARTAAVVGLLLYFPVMMSFWFAPQLVVWSDFTPLKALFFSFFAVWRNKGAFLRYLVTWIGVVVFIAAVITLIVESLGLAANTMSAFVFPATLILMAVAHGSFYQSTKAVFGEEPVTPDQA
jgi:hypothetical protein